jgi:hypothetical protein
MLMAKPIYHRYHQPSYRATVDLTTQIDSGPLFHVLSGERSPPTGVSVAWRVPLLTLNP